MYEGNPAHKRYPSKWGAPGLRSTKAMCPTEIAADDAQRVLSQGIADAIAIGHCRTRDAEPHPYIVWGRSVFPTATGAVAEIVWEARITNPGLPSWHAYPVTLDRHDSAMPRAVREYLWPTD